MKQTKDIEVLLPNYCINVLGTAYDVYCRKEQEDEKLKSVDGYCDFTSKNIVYKDMQNTDIMDMDNLQEVTNRVLRHEIIHAFMYESGLWVNSGNVDNWATNEEMIDWFAIQSPKIYKVFNQLDLIGG